MINPFACQQFTVVARTTSPGSDTEVWQLAAGIEAAVILALLIGWLASTQTRRSEP